MASCTKETLGHGRIASGNVPIVECGSKGRHGRQKGHRSSMYVDWGSMVAVGSPLRMNVCNPEGVCVPVKFPIEVVGTRVDIDSDDVQELVNAIYFADDEVNDEDEE